MVREAFIRGPREEKMPARGGAEGRAFQAGRSAFSSGSLAPHASQGLEQGSSLGLS